MLSPSLHDENKSHDDGLCRVGCLYCAVKIFTLTSMSYLPCMILPYFLIMRIFLLGKALTRFSTSPPLITIAIWLFTLSTGSYIWFYKMHRRIIPIFFVSPFRVSIKIELIHSKYYYDIFWLPLFFIRILVFHTHILHNAAAPGIIPVMGCGNIG